MGWDFTHILLHLLCSSIFSTYLLHITLSVNFNELDWHRTSHYLAQRKYSALPDIKPALADYKKCIPLLINTTSLPQSCKIKIFLVNINHSALHGPTWACAVKSLLVSSPGLAALICVLPLRELVLDAASLYTLARRKIIPGAKLVWEKRKGETTQLYSETGKGRREKKKKPDKKRGSQNGWWGRRKTLVALQVSSIIHAVLLLILALFSNLHCWSTSKEGSRKFLQWSERLKRAKVTDKVCPADFMGQNKPQS